MANHVFSAFTFFFLHFLKFACSFGPQIGRKKLKYIMTAGEIKVRLSMRKRERRYCMDTYKFKLNEWKNERGINKHPDIETVA